MKPIRHPWQLMYRMYRRVRPVLEKEFAIWQQRALHIPDPELKRQAIASLQHKKFHCEGGVVFAVQAHQCAESMIRAIVAYQILCDYLDNLCDRSTSMDPDDFRQLHTSLQDALTPDAPLRDYYRYRKEQDDGGYMAELVLTCQKELLTLPGYRQVQDRVLGLSRLYSDLQVSKHIALEKREEELLRIWEGYREKLPDIYWQEFSAVIGSTLGIFSLLVLAANDIADEERMAALESAYFPWVCGLHILLDYLIDLEEDRLGGDLNFVSYYENEQEAYERLQYFITRARESVAKIPDSAFHRMIVDGLVAFYLADRKVNRRQPVIYTISRRLMKQVRGLTSLLFYLNSLIIRRT